MTIDSTD